MDLHASMPRLKLPQLSTNCRVWDVYTEEPSSYWMCHKSLPPSLDRPWFPWSLASWPLKQMLASELNCYGWGGKVIGASDLYRQHIESCWLLMIMILYFWKGLLIAKAHGFNRKARFLEISWVQDPYCQHTVWPQLLLNESWMLWDFGGLGISGHWMPQTKPDHISTLI